MKDKSELIDEVLKNIYQEGVYFGRRAISSKDANQKPAKLAQAKATLQEAFREVEIEGGIRELKLMHRAEIGGAKRDYDTFQDEMIDDRLDELTKIKEDK